MEIMPVWSDVYLTKTPMYNLHRLKVQYAQWPIFGTPRTKVHIPEQSNSKERTKNKIKSIELLVFLGFFVVYIKKIVGNKYSY